VSLNDCRSQGFWTRLRLNWVFSLSCLLLPKCTHGHVLRIDTLRTGLRACSVCGELKKSLACCGQHEIQHTECEELTLIGVWFLIMRFSVRHVQQTCTGSNGKK
jgi:hypothetical protein